MEGDGSTVMKLSVGGTTSRAKNIAVRRMGGDIINKKPVFELMHGISYLVHQCIL